MLTQAQIDEYNRVGAIVVPDVLSADEVYELRRVTDEFVQKSRTLSSHDEIYDLEDSHSANEPRVRRIKTPHRRHPAYGRLVRHPGIVSVLRDLLGQDIRFDTAKLNMKSASFGAAVEWHQDWAFYPHTNDDLAAVGVMMDDMALENGPLMIVPGTHRGPVFDHHADGRFCGAMDPSRGDVDFNHAVPLTGPAGSITVHHVRAVHGSAPNTSPRERRLFLLQYRAADAWPLLGFPDTLEAYDELLVSGTGTIAPRLERVPVRLPLPPAAAQGSIYENQKGMKQRYFEKAAAKPALQPVK
jgi:ectoine hydroxylase-related dioxygenase (phytanoyl-CoA dioxygenase family)